MAIKRILKINNLWTESFNFQNSFDCHWLELLKTAPLPIHSHNNHHIWRWYEWGLLVFCKQTPFQLATIGTLNVYHNVIILTFNDPEKKCFGNHCGKKEKMLVTSCRQQIELKWRWLTHRAENIPGKGENAGNQQFSIFQQHLEKHSQKLNPLLHKGF